MEEELISFKGEVEQRYRQSEMRGFSFPRVMPQKKELKLQLQEPNQVDETPPPKPIVPVEVRKPRDP